MRKVMDTSFRRNMLWFLILSISMLFFCFSEASLLAAVSNEEQINEVENFNEFVEKERKKEISGVEQGNNGSEAEKLMADMQAKRKISIAIILLLSVGWVVAYLIVRKNFFLPFDYRSVAQENKFSGAELDILIERFPPILVSSIMNVGLFSKYDLIATFFDLERKDIIRFDRKNADFKAVQVSEGEGITSFEDFLLGWFFLKIGDKHFFSLQKLEEYLDLDSRAAQFDIDYDVWLDELADYSSSYGVMDKSTELWKKRFSYIAVAYAAIGLGIFYISGTAFSFLMFIFCGLSLTLPNKAHRRTKKAETDYNRLLVYKSHMEQRMLKANLSEEEWKKLFVYSIPFENTEKIFEKNNEYEKIYKAMESKLDRAVRLANFVINVDDEH